MYESVCKIRLSGTIELASGLHIGGSTAFAAIGAIDSPVIKDPLTNLPIIPGSSLKGKSAVFWQKRITTDRSRALMKMFHGSHVCSELHQESNDGKQIIRGRLIFRDALLSNKEDLRQKGLRTYTEAKFENTINRYSAVAKSAPNRARHSGSQFILN